MNFWYIVEERSHYDVERKKIGESISAEIVDVIPRATSGHHEWHDTEAVENGVYIRRTHCRTKADAMKEIRWHMQMAKPEL